MPTWKNIHDAISFVDCLITDYNTVVEIETHCRENLPRFVSYENKAKFMKSIEKIKYDQSYKYGKIMIGVQIFEFYKTKKSFNEINSRFHNKKSYHKSNMLITMQNPNNNLNRDFSESIRFMIDKNLNIFICKFVIESLIHYILYLANRYDIRIKPSINKEIEVHKLLPFLPKKNLVLVDYSKVLCKLSEVLRTYAVIISELQPIVKSKKKKVPSWYKKDITKSIEYLGEEDLIPYQLVLIRDFSYESFELNSLNIQINISRKRIQYCPVGGLSYLLENNPLHITKEIVYLKLDELHNTQVQFILLKLENLISDLWFLNWVNTLISENPMCNVDLLNFYKTKDISKYWKHQVVILYLGSFLTFLESKSKKMSNEILVKLFKYIKQAFSNKKIAIVLFHPDQNLTEKTIKNLSKILINLKSIKFVNTNIVISLFGNKKDVNKKGTIFLDKYCYPNSPLKFEFKFENFVINHIDILDKPHVLNNYNLAQELKDKIEEVYFRRVFNEWPNILDTYLFDHIKYYPCVICKRVHENFNFEYPHDKPKLFAKCHTCKTSVCQICFKQHDTLECANESMKIQIKKMVGEKTKWYNGSILIEGLSNDGVDDILEKSFNRNIPSCICQNCFSQKILTHLDSDRIGCDKVHCPICHWNGCFMCGQTINPRTYTHTHLVWLANYEFVAQLNQVVDEKYRCCDLSGLRCYLSVCSIFTMKELKLVDILWILYNIATVRHDPRHMWKNVCKRLLFMLFAPNRNGDVITYTDFPALAFIEECKKLSDVSAFYNYVMNSEYINESHRRKKNRTIMFNFNIIWRLFKLYRHNPYKIWLEAKQL